MKNILLILMYILVFQKFGMTSMRTGVFLWPSTLCDQGVENIVNKLRNNKITDVFILVKGEAGSSWLPSSYTYSDYYYKKYKEEKSEVKKKQLFRYYNLLKGTSLIDAFINASHKNNIKVHAWFIVSGDRYFIEKNPGSEVVHIQNGKAHKYPYPLIDNIHVNLSYPGYLKYFLKHVRKAMELPFDGIMLDKIRYTHLAYTWDNIHTSIAVRKGIEIDTVFDIAYKSIYGNDDEKDSFIYDYRDGNKNVTEWIKIKKDEVEKFVKETKKIAKEKKVKFSAAFMPEGAYDPNFADVNYAQNYSELSKYFDFIVIMAYAKSFNKPAAWIKMVVKNAKIRSSCDIWAGIQTYDSVASDLVYEQALNSRIAQADGIVLFRFGEVDKTYWNAYQKAIHEDINKKVNEQINGIIFSGSGTIRNCWLKSADAALLSDKIIPLLLNEKYFCSREIIAKANFVLLPGGGGSAEAKALGKVGLKNIEKYVASGGGYIGICAGAYLPIKGYMDNLTQELQIVNAKAVDIAHWNRGSGLVDLKIVQSHPIFDGFTSNINLEYYSGPILIPGSLLLPQYKNLAVFKTDIHKNGAKAGDMKGKTAILEAEYKKGKILLFSPHPELTKGKEKLLTNAMLYVSGKMAGLK